MVNEGIVLGHKISVRGIEVDKAKVDAIEKMPCPTDIRARVPSHSYLHHRHKLDQLDCNTENENEDTDLATPKDVEDSCQGRIFNKNFIEKPS